MTTTALATALRLAPSTASRHAAVLREAGLVATRRRGQPGAAPPHQGLGCALLDGAAPAWEPFPAAPPVARRSPPPVQQVGTPGSQDSATSMKMLET